MGATVFTLQITLIKNQDLHYRLLLNRHVIFCPNIPLKHNVGKLTYNTKHKQQNKPILVGLYFLYQTNQQIIPTVLRRL